MRSEIFAAALLVAGTVIAVRFLDHAQDQVVAEQQANAAAEEITSPQAGTLAPAYFGDEVRIKASQDQQFYVDADINRRSAKFLVDTGASYVALRDSDAREAGIYTAWADYTYPVTTANGETKAALVTIDEIEIDGLQVRGVKAFILQDEQLSINLLGMSFLSRLESVEARRGELVLRG